MFGKILTIDGNSCKIENLSKVTHSELMNCHVIFPEKDRKVMGEITKITDEVIDILLVGEIKNNKFQFNKNKDILKCIGVKVQEARRNKN